MLRIKKTSLHFWIVGFFGFALGLVWLLPVYSTPMDATGRNQMEYLRAFRIIAPAVVALAIACRFGIRRRLLALDILALTAFIAIPLIVFAVNGMPLLHFVYVDTPIVFSGICLLCLSIWPQWAFEGLLIGIGGAGFALIALRIGRFGIEESTFYYRARWHLGFSHPLVTSGAVLSTAIASLLLIERIGQKWLRVFLFISSILIASVFLKYADSKNTILFAAVILAAAFGKLVVKAPAIWSLTDAFLILLIVLGLASIVTYDRTFGTATLTATSSASARIEGIYQSIQMMTLGPSALWGNQDYASSIDTFAQTDSVITSYWLHYGLFGICAFLLLLLSIGVRIAYAQPRSYFEYLSIGAFWAVVSFFTIDAQGITPANLIVFLSFTLAYRIASQSHPKEYTHHCKTFSRRSQNILDTEFQ